MTDQNGIVVWFTGLSGAGKTTLARAVAERLTLLGWTVEVVDGDELRQQLSAGLGFDRCDREENARRAACLAQEIARHVDFVLVAMIAPYRTLRADIAAKLPTYCEVFVNAPLEICEARDPKGLYRRARMGQVKQFTGIDDPYEPPLNPAVECRTDQEDIEQSTQLVLRLLTSWLSGDVRHVARFIISALDKSPSIKIAELSRRIGVTPRTLASRLKKSVGRTFREIREERLMARAEQLLLHDCPVKDVAFQLGFGSPEAFGRFFRRAAGCSPGELRRNRLVP